MNFQQKAIEQMYSSKPADYYAQQLSGRGLRGKWFSQRQAQARKLVNKYYSTGVVLDIGCGNCLWDTSGIPVIGIDICESMLRYNRGLKPFFLGVKADVVNGLPVKNSSIDVVVMTEFLEHFERYDLIMSEINRVIKKNGILVVSVPYGVFPGLWGLFFPLWCRYKWWKDKDEYYRSLCGHKVSFNFKKIFRLLDHFKVLESFHISFLTVFVAARKD